MPRKRNEESGRATIRDVARLAGVSPATVSFVLNDNKDVRISPNTRQSVQRAAMELRYGAYQSSRGQRWIGLMVPTIMNHYYPALIEYTQKAAAEAGCQVLLYNTRRSEENEELFLSRLQGLDGVLYGFTPGSAARVGALAQRMPVVMLGEKAEDMPISTVSLNSHHAGALIASHLLSLGHRRIAFVTTPLDQQSLSRRKRFLGLTDALRASGVQELVIREAKSETESADEAFDMEIGRKLTLELLDAHPDVTAIVGVCDMVALGVLGALQLRGRRVPHEVSVCGFDNILLSGMMAPGLTTIDHHNLYRTRQAVDLLLEQMNRRDGHVLSIEYDPTLIVRGSTGPAALGGQ